MKKQAKKLVLAKETLWSLEVLRDVRGGSVTDYAGCWSDKLCYEEPITDPANGC